MNRRNSTIPFFHPRARVAPVPQKIDCKMIVTRNRYVFMDKTTHSHLAHTATVFSVRPPKVIVNRIEINYWMLDIPSKVVMALLEMH
jgi:hypothetical protein